MKEFIQRYCPDAKTVGQSFHNSSEVASICDEFNCEESDYVLSLNDIYMLINVSYQSKEFYDNFYNVILNIDNERYCQINNNLDYIL